MDGICAAVVGRAPRGNLGGNLRGTMLILKVLKIEFLNFESVNFECVKIENK